MVTFDPAKLRFERTGSRKAIAAGLGTVLTVVYDGKRYFRTSACEGARQKFLIPEAGVIIKADENTIDQYATAQGWEEWRAWNALPDELRSDFQPLLGYAVARIPNPQPQQKRGPDGRFLPWPWIYVSWTAQELLGEHSVGCPHHTFDAMCERAKAAGFRLGDCGPRQTATRADGSVVWMDYGFWQPSPESSPEEARYQEHLRAENLRRERSWQIKEDLRREAREAQRKANAERNREWVARQGRGPQGLQAIIGREPLRNVHRVRVRKVRPKLGANAQFRINEPIDAACAAPTFSVYSAWSYRVVDVERRDWAFNAPF